MKWLHREPPSLLQRGAYLLLLGAAAVSASTTYGAWVIAPMPESSGDLAQEPPPQLGERVVYRVADAVRAVERDPFHPDRRAPLERYVLPDADAGATVSLPGSERAAPIRLLGTAVTGSSGGFAMCQVGREVPRMLHVGDTLGGLTLRSISRAAAEFTDAQGTVVTLRLPGATDGVGE